MFLSYVPSAKSSWVVSIHVLLAKTVNATLRVSKNDFMNIKPPIIQMTIFLTVKKGLNLLIKL